MHLLGRSTRGKRGLELARLSSGAARFGATAVGATAVGATALAALAIGRLAIGRAVIRQLRIEELEVTRLRVRELSIDAQQGPGSVQAKPASVSASRSGQATA